jgi:RHH-type transcriptional regulator, rel operon repressor / antitoxin RelB
MSLTSSDIEASMSQVTARLPDDLVASLDEAAKELRKSRAEIIRAAVEMYLAEYEDLAIAVSRLRDPADPVLDWENVRRDLLGKDQG